MKALYRSPLALLAILLALGASFTQTTAISTFSAKVKLDTATTKCWTIKATAVAQQHRAIVAESDVFEQRTQCQNRPSPDHDPAAEQIVEVFGGSIAAVDGRLTQICSNGLSPSEPPPLLPTRHLRGMQSTTQPPTPVVRRIVDSGNPSNRIDVVFMGDGYTASEQTRFFDDIQRLTNEMFTGDTFAQYLPLFNIWAAYLPSTESGIGVGGTPKNTVFGLYRDGTELRGVYASNPSKARTICNGIGKDACDFPALIGNDDYYGGLGGEFVITTKSTTSGTIALRHELGHNFGSVGEEYDGGEVYSGANSAKTIDSVPWKHWLTDPSSLVEQKSALLYQKHIWYDLKQGAYDIVFNSTGAYNRWYIKLSVSGADTSDALVITLDGVPLAWKSSGQKDRTFYTWTESKSGFSAGTHTLRVRATGAKAASESSSSIITQLCNAAIYEYKDESEFKLDDKDYIGIYPTYSVNKVKTYRPDNEKCLMRNMTSTSFCSVCKENMWLKFMARIEFIDDVVVTGKRVAVKLIPLGQLRPATDGFIKSNPELAAAERYTIKWFNAQGEELVKLRDQVDVDLEEAARANCGVTGGDASQWTVRVSFATPSVRLDPTGLLQSERSFSL